ncbi:MAG: hypothetical protein CFH18_00061 [Alphaproteobacteria bacterium MarineAlpha5_Bin8]|nr:MAG: hypothetical protein CFH17_01140 [Alphaproteobacteria bacterium MarineAlpha5_Bin7]PPR48374.1 MAG: hypothetical protein CFH18_00061 [Alphaproteobacteria bacterium MarineAlpha5_Bin8]PPR54766.1 MAG: hypothetical protein CFH16_00215 [Alphaproteobacteria bacterium MarineAlpha5_Bin6]|tara:strand:- start:1449 stop:2039 length:591 start_codon:yes stop_codon:yes gene_type:complete
MKFKIVSLVILSLSIFFLNSVYSKTIEETYREKVFNYIKKVEEFESRFIQIQENEVQNGSFYKGNNRIRIIYDEPTSIEFVIKKNNAMYFNKNLQEVQYFGTKNNNAKIFFDLFNDLSFLDDANFKNASSMFYFYKDINVDDEAIEIKVYFEESPILLRRIDILEGENITNIYINNINFNPDFDKDFFSLANPLLK